MKKLFALLPVLLLLTGCVGGTSQVEVTPPYENQVTADGTPVTGNVMAANRGVYLFNCIPIWSGFPDLPNRRRYKPFRNFVREGYNVMMMERMLPKAQGDELRDVKSEYYSSGAWSLWILWNRSLTTTGAAVKLPDEEL